MKRTCLILLVLGALLMGGCGYIVVEDYPTTTILAPTPSPTPSAS